MSLIIIEKKCSKCNSYYDEVPKEDDRIVNDYDYEIEEDTSITYNKCSKCSYDEKLYLWKSGRGYHP